MTADVLCVGAHPDDIEIGMGASIAKLVRTGTSVAMVDLTNGEPTPHGTPELRAQESARAAEILGVTDRVTLDLPNRYLFDSREAREKLAEVIRRVRPQVLFVPYPVDAHPDHIAASQIANAARFYAKLTKTDMAGEPHYPSRIYRYMAVHQRILVEPSFVHVVDDVDMQTKLRALESYESQFSTNKANQGIVPMMRELSAMWGAMVNAQAGEPFFAVEPLGLDSLDSLV